MPSPLPVLVGILRRTEGLAEEADGPRHLPGHGRGPSGGDGSLAIRSQQLLQPVQLRLAQHLLASLLQDLHAHHPVHLRSFLTLVYREPPRSALAFVQGKWVETDRPKGRSGGRDSRARASVFLRRNPALYGNSRND